jgi:broad specificity phosphatase PhoE
LPQASTLVEKFPDTTSIAVVITSPLTRALQTTTAGFPQVLRKDSAGGVQLIIDPDLQERSDLPCDTGSGRAELEDAFPDLDFGDLQDEWFVKEGLYAAGDDVVAKRAQRFRDKLQKIATSLEKDGVEDKDGRQKSIVIVTHGVFMKVLTGDEDIDLPKAGWRAFKIARREDGGAILEPLE